MTKQEKSILNNCRKCGGEPILSKALVNKVAISEDLGSTEGGTRSMSKDVSLIDCLKCRDCGHSWTEDTERQKRIDATLEEAGVPDFNKIAERFPKDYTILGVHPMNIKRTTD